MPAAAARRRGCRGPRHPNRTPEGGEAAAPAKPARAPRVEVEPDQETFDRVLASELEKGTDRRVAEGRAKSAALRAARAKGEGT